MPLHQYLTPWQGRSLVGPWFVVHCKPTARFISQLSGHFLLYSVLKIPVRRADVEKLGCLSFRCFKKKHKTLPPSHHHLQILYWQDIYAYIYVLQSESPPPSLPKNTHTHTTNPSLATLPGWSDNTRHGFMASWLLQWNAWIQTRSTHTLFRPCAFFCFPPRARPRREGEQATQQKPVGSAAAILLQSVCTHLSGSEGKRKGTVRDPRSVIKGMCFHACVCVCVCETERERRRHLMIPTHA